MYTGPNITSNGLVLHLDAANNKSYLGEDTVNLAYNNGVLDWSSRGLTVNLYTETVFLNNRFRLVSSNYKGSYTSGSIRFDFSSDFLEDGETYTLSYKWKKIYGSSNFYMEDWGDSNLFNKVDEKRGDYNFSSASGKRSFYSEVYSFMDLHMEENTCIEIWDIQLEKRDYSTPFVSGIRNGIWKDLSGFNNDGILINNPNFSSDNNGVLEFSKPNQSHYVSNLDIKNKGTVSFWFRYLQDKPKGSSGAILGEYYKFMLYSNVNSPVNNFQSFIYYDGNPGGHISVGPINVTIGDWFNFVVSWSEDGRVRSYINGNIFVDELASSSFVSWKNNFSVFSVNTVFSLGQVGMVSAYNRALNIDEVMAAYDSIKSRFK